MSDRTCPSCNHNNDLAANFCSSCGERIGGGPDATTEALSVVELGESSGNDHLDDRAAIARGTGLLVVEEGPKSGSRYALDSEVITAGRHPESDIFLDDVTVSRRHVEVTRTEAGIAIHDVGSLNGTYLNRERIDEPVVLRSGDEVQVGKFKMVFLSEDP